AQRDAAPRAADEDRALHPIALEADVERLDRAAAGAAGEVIRDAALAHLRPRGDRLRACGQAGLLCVAPGAVRRQEEDRADRYLRVAASDRRLRESGDAAERTDAIDVVRVGGGDILVGLFGRPR